MRNYVQKETENSTDALILEKKNKDRQVGT